MLNEKLLVRVEDGEPGYNIYTYKNLPYINCWLRYLSMSIANWMNNIELHLYNVSNEIALKTRTCSRHVQKDGFILLPIVQLQYP